MCGRICFTTNNLKMYVVDCICNQSYNTCIIFSTKKVNDEACSKFEECFVAGLLKGSTVNDAFDGAISEVGIGHGEKVKEVFLLLPRCSEIHNQPIKNLPPPGQLTLYGVNPKSNLSFPKCTDICQHRWEKMRNAKGLLTTFSRSLIPKSHIS
jgi:hypothetical protein